MARSLGQISSNVFSALEIGPCQDSAPAECPKTAALIDAYFSFAHSLLPVLDEAHFRLRIGTKGGPLDDGWLGLRSVVLAIGSYSCSIPGSLDHFAYFAQGLNHVGPGATLDTVQALLLLGGQYLVYIDQYGMAELLLHKAIKVAASIGPGEEHWGNVESLPAPWRRTIQCLSSFDQTQATPPVSVPARRAREHPA